MTKPGTERKSRGRPKTGATPAAQRKAEQRDRLKASGGKRIEVSLSAEAVAALDLAIAGGQAADQAAAVLRAVLKQGQRDQDRSNGKCDDGT